MRKISILLFAAAVLFASCAKDPVMPEVYNQTSVTISASLSEFGTKTVTDIDNVTKWVTDDEITITDNSTSKTYQYKVKEGGSATAGFVPVDAGNVLPAADSYNLSAVYAGGVTSCQTNVYGRTSEAPLSATFSGAAENGEIKLVFSQDASLITFSFVDAKNGKAPFKLSQLVIESIGGEEIADGSSIITVTPEGDATSTYQTVVSKIALSKGLLIKATSAEDAASAAGGTEFPAGTEFCKIIKQGGADLSNESGVHAVVTVLLNQQGISSKSDLVSFGYVLEHQLSVSNYIGGTYNYGGHATPEISVLADIDMGGTLAQPIEWHPIGEGCSEDETLRYYFNGHEHNIYNFNVVTDASYFGLFGDVYDVTYWGGQIVNLNLGTRDGETWDGVSKITLESNGNGDHYIGSFIGRVKKNSKGNGNWQMLNCKNFVPIEISSDNNDKAYVGGLVGNASRVLFKDCKNYGDITNNSSEFGICIGGFAGVVWDKLTQKFDNCENYGDITVNNKGVEYVGGFVSRFTPANPGNSNVNTFTNCKNYGNITVNAVSTSIRVGGLVGDVIANDAYSCSFEECSNEGGISVTLAQDLSTEDLISAGGIVGRGEAPVIYDSCTNSGSVSVGFDNSSAKAACRIGGIFGDNTDMDSDCNGCRNTGDITVTVSNSNSSPGNYCFGGIAGRLNVSSTTDGQDGSEFKECSNEGALKITANRGVIGGMVGAMADGSLIECSNTGTVEYHYKSQADTWAAAGGLVGDVCASAKAITGCTNEGDIVCSTYGKQDVTNRGCYVGGIAGWTEENTIVISGCENRGEVRGNTHAGGSVAVPAAGGIIGYKESSTTDYDNINRGHVISIGTHDGSKATAGGVVGSLHYGTIESCWNCGFVEAGEKEAQWDWEPNSRAIQYAGSIAGWYNTTTEGPNLACEGTITKCYVGGIVNGNKTSGTQTTLTSSNWSGLIVGCGTDPTDCCFVSQ